MKVDVLTPRSGRGKLSPGQAHLTWRCAGTGGDHPVDHFEVRILELERRRLRMPDDLSTWEASRLFQWLLDRAGPHGSVASRVENVDLPAVTLRLAPDRIYACRISAPAVPELHPATTVIFTKAARNYLRARLERRRPSSSDEPRRPAPLVPLLAFQLDRYLHLDPAARDPLDRAFDQLLSAREQTLGGPASYRHFLDSYRDIPRATLEAVYGPVAMDRDDTAWRGRTARALFEEHPLARSLLLRPDPPRTFTLALEHEGFTPPRAIAMDASFPVPSDWIREGESLWLRLRAGNEQRWVRMSPTTRASLAIADHALDDLDGAIYAAELWALPTTLIAPDESAPGGRRLTEPGTLEIQGGAPIVLSIEPSSVALGAGRAHDEVTLRVRNAGRGGDAELGPNADADRPRRRIPSLQRVAQSFEHQTFAITFEVGAPPSGTYPLAFLRHDEGRSPVPSRNTLSLGFDQRVCTAFVDRIQCVDESDPEWWGDDSIQLAMRWCTNTGFGTKPTVIRPNKSFSRGTVEELRDGRRVFGPRAVEGRLVLAATVIELDELGWMDALGELLTSFLPILLGAFTAQRGGTFLRALDLAGTAPSLFDDVGDAVADAYAGFGKEVLHQGTVAFTDFSAPSRAEILTMKSSERAYAVHLHLTAGELAPSPSG
jgi:hypothetical protein